MLNFTLLPFFFRIPGIITLGNPLARGVMKAEGLVNFQKQMTSAVTAPWGGGGKKHPEDHQSSCFRAQAEHQLGSGINVPIYRVLHN